MQVYPVAMHVQAQNLRILMNSWEPEMEKKSRMSRFQLSRKHGIGT
jgi:hypothetical protein